MIKKFPKEYFKWYHINQLILSRHSIEIYYLPVNERITVNVLEFMFEEHNYWYIQNHFSNFDEIMNLLFFQLNFSGKVGMFRTRPSMAITTAPTIFVFELEEDALKFYLSI